MTCCERKHPLKGERVAIIREQHGWHDGALSGIVIEVYCAPPKSVSYTIRADDGAEYFCPKTNDVRRI